MKHYCKLCEYETIRIDNFYRHIESNKHKSNIETIKKEEETIKKIASMETNVINNINEVKNEVKNDVNNVKKALEKKITKEVQNVAKDVKEVKKIANKNREYAKSTLTILNESYKDNPPLEYPGDRKCLTALHEYYKLTVTQVMNTNKLQKAIVRDYTKKTLVDSIIKILTSFLKKDNLHSQSVFNTDVSRHNYTAKHKDSWEKDKKGIYLNDLVIKPFCSIIKILMQNYKKYKFDWSKEYKKKLLNKDKYEDSDDVFMNKNETETETEFAYRDDSSDENRRGIEELEELCEINNLIKYIESNRLYDDIMLRLSPILNYNLKIKNKSF
jgi:hypothetical protein